MLKKQLILESIEEEVLDFLKNLINGTEWENRVYLAGGAVRDEVMGKAPKDLDFVIDGNITSGIDFATWLTKKLGNYKEDSNPVIYPKYGTAKISLNNNKFNLPGIELEFVAPRLEKYSEGSRKPEVTQGKLMDDVLRRDLTINSLLKNVSTNEILDMTGNGIQDIKNGIIRTTSDPEIIFKDDPLRMLRAIRFTVKYGFEIGKDILQNIKKYSDLINIISSERIKDELNKILISPNPDKGIRLLKITGLLNHILPEFNETIGMKQNKHHKDDVFKHTMSVLSNTPPELKTRLMALFHDIGKVLTRTVSPDGSVHFYGHEKASEEMVNGIMKRLNYPNELIGAVSDGVRHHMSLKGGEDDASKLSDKTLRKFTAAVGGNLEYILDLIHADNISHTEESSMPNQVSMIRQRLSQLDKQLDQTKLKLPINGNDIINMGFKRGQIVGEILSAVQDAWYENPNITRDEAIDIVNQFKIQNNINEIKEMIRKII